MDSVALPQTAAPAPPAAGDSAGASTTTQPAPLPPPKSVNVIPEAQDDEIAQRLIRILDATEWFRSGEVKVQQGVVTLDGETSDAKYQAWASNLAQNTEDVVAVVNRIRITQRRLWDLSPAWNQMRDLSRQAIQGLPLFVVSLAVLLLTFVATRWADFWGRRIISRRVPNPILQQVGGRVVAIPVALIGIYLALRICGLTQLALTVAGGTGLAGLIVGIAFRDIAENFLASLLISMERPFQLGDLIEVNNMAGITVQGLVQSVTTRGTVLLTMDGNHLQIPNALIYKNVVNNLTTNPKIRLNFPLPLSQEVPLESAQEAVLEVLQRHPAVLQDPEPLVLVEELAVSGATLRVYCWIDSRQNSSLKTRSALLRLAKAALRKAHVSGPPVIAAHSSAPRALSAAPEPAMTSTAGAPGGVGRPHAQQTGAEGGLANETADIEKQAKAARNADDRVNLLSDDDRSSNRC
ncbi:mechanosensitive ion channel domain-containing protein [Planctomicrobium piriforme]|nr:mechanosensitive ion channel domain-containing protein [Planctomicrobium piriforme]